MDGLDGSQSDEIANDISDGLLSFCPPGGSASAASAASAASQSTLEMDVEGAESPRPDDGYMSDSDGYSVSSSQPEADGGP
eukprot:5494981-Alexandrium_andersonii.AAC.1